MIFTQTAQVTFSDFLSADIVEMLLFAPDIAQSIQAGQFVHVRALHSQTLLRRPFSLWKKTDTEIGILFRVLGQGTKDLAALKKGDEVDVFGPLGHGWPDVTEPVLYFGGGLGIAPFLEEALVAQAKGRKRAAYFGFTKADDVIGLSAFEHLGYPLELATVDGSYGQKGFVTALWDAAIERDPQATVFGCGPTPFMKALKSLAMRDGIPLYLSLEERMGCAFGVCLGCSMGDYQRVCKEGPVFLAEEVHFA